MRIAMLKNALRMSLVGVLVGSMFGCGGESQNANPPPRPSAAASVAPVPPPPPPPPAPSAAPSASTQLKYTTEIVIHQAEIHGKIKLRAGKKLVVEPLVATSTTQPLKGNKAEVFRVIEKQGADNEWLKIADAEIATNYEVGKNLEVTITDEKKDVLLNGKPANHWLGGTMVRVLWQW